jgi:hypothetical protein
MDYYKKYIKYKKKYLNLKGGLVKFNKTNIFNIKDKLLNLKNNITDNKKIEFDDIYNFLKKINFINKDLNIWNDNNKNFINKQDKLNLYDFCKSLSNYNKYVILETLKRINESVKLAKEGTKLFPSLDNELLIIKNK